MKSLIVIILIMTEVVMGHMAVYVPSMWGSEPNFPNSNWAVNPLQDFNYSDWVLLFYNSPIIYCCKLLYLF